ncbi:MAG TPA: glycine cleavage T C-terminal barrel domain-containing protein, partial [Burkholderiales bacterium]
DPSVTPLESGLAWTVDLSGDRDFIGRQALLDEPRRRLVGLLALERGVLRSHQKVQTARGAGEITSGSFSPTLEQSIALARVPAGVAVGDEVGVDVRGRMLAARVVKYPFVRNGKRLV